MNAKEMFEKLGWEREILINENIRYSKRNSNVIYVLFDKKDKTYVAYDWCSYAGKCILYIDIELHKAIQKQIEELEW